jgi:small ligand-binding sensory domain FIST
MPTPPLFIYSNIFLASSSPHDLDTREGDAMTSTMAKGNKESVERGRTRVIVAIALRDTGGASLGQTRAMARPRLLHKTSYSYTSKAHNVMCLVQPTLSVSSLHGSHAHGDATIRYPRSAI